MGGCGVFVGWGGGRGGGWGRPRRVGRGGRGAGGLWVGGIHFSILLSPLFRDYAGLMARRRQLQCIPKEGNPAFYKGG